MRLDNKATYTIRIIQWILPLILSLAVVTFTPPRVAQGGVQSRAAIELVVSEKPSSPKKVLVIHAESPVVFNYQASIENWLIRHHDRMTAIQWSSIFDQLAFLQSKIPPIYARGALADPAPFFI